MALQVRIIHPLGDQLVEVTPRGAGQPFVVGRANDADVTLPSTTVSRRHCILFIHNGQWVIQDGGSSRGTYLNGQRISQPTPINSGDVATLGPEAEAPRLVIGADMPGGPDCGMAGGTAEVVAGLSGSRPPALQRPAGPRPIPGGVISGAALSYGVAVPPPMGGVPRGVAQAEVGESGDDWMNGGPANSTGSLRRRKPVRKKASQAPAIAIGVILCGGLVALLICFLLYKPKPAQIVVIEPPGASGPVATGSKAKTNIFADMDQSLNGQPAAPAAPPAAGPAANPAMMPAAIPAVVAPDGQAADANTADASTTRSAGASGAVSPNAMPRPAKAPDSKAIEEAKRNDPEWQRVEDAHDNVANQYPERAIIAYEDYLTLAPDSKFKADVQAYTDDAVDKLWWLRIGAAVRERTDIKAKLNDVRHSIADSATAASKAEYNAEKADLESQLDKVEKLLADMNYTASTEPNIMDDAQLDGLRKARSADSFEKFRKIVMREVNRTHGVLPWHTGG